jgi:acyl-CoA synthetase (AMP-forming)/AMP-acid ligase II
LRYPDRFKKAFSNVKIAAQQAEGYDQTDCQEHKELAPGIEILPMYGQTEATARLGIRAKGRC